MDEMGPVETEIKLRVEGGAPVAAHLLEQRGYRVREPRMLQADQLFDLSTNALQDSDRLLRVRSSGDVSTLTYKGPSLGGPHKRREELETQVQDGVALRSILFRLGYLPGFRYEKYRTTFTEPGEESGANIGLDETPIGVFLELEGPADWIDKTARRLGFSPPDYVTASYRSLYREHLKLHGGPADMVFNELQTTEVQQPAAGGAPRAGEWTKKT
ncbi:MAG TPA: class IV adenylate cyclase [Bryobacteraceae bacterium]|jgi:adenylate cyclase class 2